MVVSDGAVSDDPHIKKIVMESFKHNCQMFYIIICIF